MQKQAGNAEPRKGYIDRPEMPSRARSRMTGRQSRATPKRQYLEGDTAAIRTAPITEAIGTISC
eukprot:5049532-Pyramimonas_sp.AAC.1